DRAPYPRRPDCTGAQPMSATTRTVDDALAHFELVEGAGSPTEGTACVMTAVSWIAGEAWTDSPSCARRLLRNLAIAANDAEGTSAQDRAEILRAGEHGLIDTWWIPDAVVAA